ncbi:CarD family transcriptional regulator [Lihuaxuella thermophila]|uniref:CarD family transcriptional regulator n=1 Tax=Lihuaxuella thermophila TaxID=1173111 RepID=A0A1H8F3M8_9BACL|nr:CarD family transcriptional regulator [Lihuaxuella thermophila]SEN26501.1 CarD family transcriptional regulator [Lihuaxuella thermophila]
MFEVGDKVMYPMYGAGVIQAIQEKEILGKKQYYYMIHMPVVQLEVMIPVRKASDLGIRPVADPMTLDEILSQSAKEELDSSVKWNQRYRIYLEKIKTGNIQDEAEVIRDLAYRSKNKNLNFAERGVLNQAKQLFISELVLAKEITEIQAAHLLDQMTGKE